MGGGAFPGKFIVRFSLAPSMRIVSARVRRASGGTRRKCDGTRCRVNRDTWRYRHTGILIQCQGGTRSTWRRRTRIRRPARRFRGATLLFLRLISGPPGDTRSGATVGVPVALPLSSASGACLILWSTLFADRSVCRRPDTLRWAHVGSASLEIITKGVLKWEF